jgi:hypothetical protein
MPRRKHQPCVNFLNLSPNCHTIAHKPGAAQWLGGVFPIKARQASRSFLKKRTKKLLFISPGGGAPPGKRAEFFLRLFSKKKCFLKEVLLKSRN